MRWTLLVIVISLFWWPQYAFATTVPAGTGTPPGEQEKYSFDMTEVENYISSLDSEIKKAVPQVNFKENVMKIVKREVNWSPGEVFKGIINYFFKEVVANFSLLGKLILLAVICAVLQNMTSAFGRAATGQITYTITYLVMVILALGSFTLAVNSGREVVDKMVGFMQAILPLLLTLLVAVGGFASAAIFQPVLFTSIAIIGTLMKNVVLPLIFFSVVLSIVSNLSSGFKVSNLAGLFKTAALGLMGIFSTVFLGLLTIQGVAGAVGDGVTLRTAKYATNAFIPVVGGMFSDALEAIVSSSLLIKNAVGIAGVLAIITVAAMPLLKIMCLAFIYKLAGALIQPVGDGQVVECLNDMGSGLMIIFAAVATVGLLFFFTIAIVVAMGNFAVMLR